DRAEHAFVLDAVVDADRTRDHPRCDQRRSAGESRGHAEADVERDLTDEPPFALLLRLGRELFEVLAGRDLDVVIADLERVLPGIVDRGSDVLKRLIAVLCAHALEGVTRDPRGVPGEVDDLGLSELWGADLVEDREVVEGLREAIALLVRRLRAVHVV